VIEPFEKFGVSAKFFVHIVKRSSQLSVGRLKVKTLNSKAISRNGA
jgi:hypothetical protein